MASEADGSAMIISLFNIRSQLIVAAFTDILEWGAGISLLPFLFIIQAPIKFCRISTHSHLSKEANFLGRLFTLLAMH